MPLIDPASSTHPASSTVPASSTDPASSIDTPSVIEAAFDLDAYLRHIGFTNASTIASPPAPTLETLRAITRLHPAVIPYENLNPLLRWPVPLDIASLQRKMVRDGRGGWCFEHNTLLMQALRAIGFDVTGLAARVLWNREDDAITPRSHMVLRVALEDGPWLVDVGFGGMTMTGPIRFDLDVAQETPLEPYRLIQPASGSDLFLQAELPEGWKTLFRFSLQPQQPIDYEVASWFLCTHPSSHFLQGLNVARATPERRYGLRQNQWVEHARNGHTERRTLGTVAEIRAALEGPLGLRLPPESPELEAALARAAAFTPPPSTA